ncbi:chemotaxis protein CheX [Alkalicoccobacillus murimartini]|uniref:Chemotaxis protein CheX n=1 Tax=Alkalicoccobacillus murimartini TaxID=171685 RepID=A0ABT9YBR6_9BACI|nr:chemotaxis protein CheX [Alkalicoccobacillus murimartini]MDQ0205282.1 chemotaxis protein CheX [Alkalicoccobacillus murimartini]
MDARYVNAIVRATKGILTNHLGAEVNFLLPKLGEGSVTSNDISVILGVKGELAGQIICSFDKNTAKNIVSTMMGGMPIEELDEMGWSAVREFGNWIAGSTATELSLENCIIDVTPPVTNEGLSIFHSSEKYLTLSLESSLGLVQIHLSFQAVEEKIRS